MGLLREIEQMSKDNIVAISDLQDKITEGLCREEELKIKL